MNQTPQIQLNETESTLLQLGGLHAKMEQIQSDKQTVLEKETSLQQAIESLSKKIQELKAETEPSPENKVE